MRELFAQELKAAMREKDEVRISTLRLIIAAVKDSDIAKRGGDSAGGNAAADEAGLQALLATMIKQREESIRAYEEGGRLELADRERREIAIIREFLPPPFSEEEAKAAIEAAIAELGAASMRDMGKVMGLLKTRYAGRMDFTAAAAGVRRLLG